METQSIKSGIIFLIIAGVVGAGAYIYQKNNSEKKIEEQKIQQEVITTQPMKKQFTQAEQVIQAGKKYQATLKTSKGEIMVELLADATPKTVNNFVFLAKQGFYNNTIFHRVIRDFMIQGGDPDGNGTGGPGYRFADEAFSGEYTRGTLAMANAGPNTNGSQFFIMHKDVPLEKNYVIFGRVISGMETVDKIAESDVTYSSTGERSQPTTPITLESVDIQEL
jgi:peptidylprolyl isomerase